ncbi:ARM repeat-containing protein [Mycena alexandri]|uniref:MMS19 nucleotide excision repair protein n=1 Tax=Mycena alexandri TaxID=1745969 RepID=A0AAD6S3Y3_9AGAR|nr:ARM repeat-containing protein [Mycena alexandri]
MAPTSSTSAQATDSIEQLVTTWMVSGRDEEVTAAVAEVSEGRLLGVVKALGTYLTAEQDDLRTKGVDFLATVIARCAEKTLNRQSVKVLTAFFCDKLDDTETIVPALKGLASLPPICSSADALVIVNALFTYVKMRALVQSVRFHVFSIIDGLIAHHREALKDMKSAFIAPYITLAEGEKDPRNLLLAFAIARVILIEFDPAASHIEPLSNILFCYFPITFRPPPNDPYGITADDLRNALRRCLSAHPAFGPIAIPIFLEKLAAGSPAIKRDTLHAMRECFPVYGPAVARSSARKLWNSIKLEIFQPTDSTTEAMALATMQALIVTIHSSRDEDASANKDGEEDGDVQTLARDACEECLSILREPEKSQAKPAIKVLCAFMATTPSVARYTLAQAVPHLLKLFADPREANSRHPILLLLSDVIAAARDSVAKSSKTESMSDSTVEVPLAPFKNEILGALISGLAAVSTTGAALAGLTGLVSTPGLLSDDELGFIVLKANDVLDGCFDAAEEERSDDSTAILQLLLTISSTAPSHVRDQTLPRLFASLPPAAPPRDALAARARYQHVLRALSTLCGPATLFASLVSALTPKLTSIAFEESADAELSAAYLHALLAALKRTLAGKVDAGDVDVAGYVDSLVPTLYGICVRAAIGVAGVPAREPRVVGGVGDIVGLVVQSLEPRRQQVFSSVLFPAFLEGKIAPLCISEHVKVEDKFLPFTAEATTTERNLLVLFEAGVVPLDPSVKLDADINARIEMILSQGLACANNERQVETVLRIVGSIANKHVDELGSFLEHTKTTYWSTQILEPNSPHEARRQAIRVWTWISKALLVRNHPSALSDFIHRLFDLFGDATVGTDAAKAFGDIASADAVLTKRNGAVVKFLWAQKFATGILPRLMNGARNESDAVQQHTHLIALTALLKAIPNAAYAHEMDELLPLLLRALPLPDAQIRANVLETLLAAAQATHAPTTSSTSSTHATVLAEHAATIVRAVLGYTRAETELTSTRIRISALRYLRTLPALIPYAVLHPVKAEALRVLGAALDDPKRAVRREAVDAREVWFKYTG